MSVYNGELYLKETIKSVINQSYKKWELIIVDNCSTDTTIDILNEEKVEVDEFIDSLPLDAFDKIKEFFLNMPRLEHVIEYKRPKCERDNFISLNGYEHFFG